MLACGEKKENLVGPFRQAYSQKWQCLIYFQRRIGLAVQPAKRIFVTTYFSLVHILWPFSFLSIHKRMLISHVFRGMAFPILGIVWSTLPEIYLTILDWVRHLLPWFPLVCPSVQFSCSVVSDSLWPHELQHARPPCPSPTPGVHPNSCPSSRWCHLAISSSVVPFSSCPQSLPASESFPVSQLFTWGGHSTGVSALASFLPKNTQNWSPFRWTGWTSLQSKGLSRVFSEFQL